MFLIKIWKYSRPLNLVIIIVTLLLGYFSMSSRSIQQITNHEIELLILMSVSLCCIAASGYWLNDFYDYNIDKINRSGQKHLHDEFTKNQIFLACAIINGIGLVSSWYIGITIFFCCISNVILLVFYSFFKRTFLMGNIIVAYLCASVLFVAYWLANDTWNTPYLDKIQFYLIFSFLISMVREIIKDLEDMEGDKIYGCTTLPLLFGLKNTKFAIWILLITLSYFLLKYIYMASSYKLIYLLIMVWIPLIILGLSIVPANDKKDFARISKYCKIIMIAGLVGLTMN